MASLTGKGDPPVRAVPLLTRLASSAITWLTWPWYVRQLKRAGFRRVGWMAWESGPPEPQP